MNLKTLLTTTILASAISFGGAFAHATKTSNQFQDYYGKLEAGLTIPSKVKASIGTTKTNAKFKKGFVGGFGAGYIVNDFFRTDLMIQYRQAKHTKKSQTAKLDTTNYSAVLNGYLTAHNDTVFTPYLTFGAGVGQNKAKIKSVVNKTLKKTTLVWNAGLGCQAKVHDNISLDLGYRYVNLGKLSKKNVGGTTITVKTKKIASHEVLAGVVYNF